MAKTLPIPQINASVSPTKLVYEVRVEQGDNQWWPEDYKFSVDVETGSVTINDTEFSSKEVAAQAFKAMSTFLSKK